MNRVEHLKQTLPINIELIFKYGAELVIVNYDSKDDLHEYITNNYEQYILDNTIKYIKIKKKEFFNRFHAKNIAHRYSSGDILINLDADNILTENVILDIIKYFNEDMNYLLHCGYNQGFIVMSRYTFFMLGGYNELMKNYGMEDIDLVFRGFYCLGNLNFKYLDDGIVKVIEHTDNCRMLNLENTDDIDLEYNREIYNYYIDKKIINPNLYNNIDWGKIDE
jgi:predicted glycosyltransferase involved in capsule biosynthesis